MPGVTLGVTGLEIAMGRGGAPATGLPVVAGFGITAGVAPFTEVDVATELEGKLGSGVVEFTAGDCAEVDEAVGAAVGAGCRADAGGFVFAARVFAERLRK
jgi:hypothetical protein